MTKPLLKDYRPDIEPNPWRPEPKEQERISPHREERKRSLRVWLGVFLCLVATVLVAAKISGILDVRPQPHAAGPVVRTSVVALGWLEPASNVIKVAAPSTVEASRVSELLVVEGDVVAEGQIIAVLDTAKKLRAQLNTAQAQVELKRSHLHRVKLDVLTSIVAKRMAIARARADLEQSETEFVRQQTLVAREVATSANLEKRKRDLAVAQAQIEESEAALKRLEAAFQDVRGGEPVQIDVAVAERELAAAEADLAQVSVLLDQASIRSPIQGRVLTVMTRAGEKIVQDGVIEVGSTSNMVAVAEVYHSDISLIRQGQKVELRADTLKQPIRGQVERVGLKVKRQSIINNDPATDTDARVIEVRVKLDPDSSTRVAGLTRLQIRLHFALDQLQAEAAASSGVSR
jgi:HlyD family secretion protein